METLLKLQKASITDLQSRIDNFRKDSADRKTTPYFERKIVQLDDWYQIFKNRHQELQKEPDETQPYFANHTFDSTKNLYREFRNRLRDALGKLTGDAYADDNFQDSSFNATNNEHTPAEGDGAHNSSDTSKNGHSSVEGQDDNGSNNSFVTSKNGHFSTKKKDDALDENLAILQLVHVLYEEVANAIAIANELSVNDSHGYIKAQLDLLRETWGTFRENYFAAKSRNASLDFNMQQIQCEYARATGKVNDMLTGIGSSKSNENIQLPKIKIPDFYGKATEWRTYVELFNKIIHNNSSINDAIKMQYLKTSLKGEAAKLVAHLAPTGENYKSCYQLLDKRFNNKRELLGNMIDAILNFPKCKSENGEELRKLHDTANENILAIRNLDIDTANWDPLVIHILMQKLHKDKW